MSDKYDEKAGHMLGHTARCIIISCPSCERVRLTAAFGRSCAAEALEDEARNYGHPPGDCSGCAFCVFARELKARAAALSQPSGSEKVYGEPCPKCGCAIIGVHLDDCSDAPPIKPEEAK